MNEQINSEIALIGLLIKKPDLVDHCQLISNFENPFIGNHLSQIFTNIKKLYNTTGKVDFRSLMKLNQPLIRSDYYSELMRHYGFDVSIHEYVQDVYSSLLKRKLTGLGCTLINCHEDEINTGSDFLRTSRVIIDELEKNSCVTTGVSIAEAIQEIYDKTEALGKEDNRHYMKTGILSIDRIIMGLTTKTMSIWGARPSVGKTALAVTVMSNMTQGGIACGFVSVEMSEAEIVERIAQVRSGVSVYEFAKNNMLNKDKVGFYDELNKIGDCPFIQIERTTNRKIGNIRSIIRKMKNNNPELKVVFIDYVQKIQGDDRSQDMRMQVNEISSTLTDMATDMDIHIGALAQLNRQGDEAPKLIHLKESGKLEEDAHNVFLIHRDLEEQHQGNYDGDAFISIAKNRGGKTGLAQIKYNGKTTRFYDDCHNYAEEV